MIRITFVLLIALWCDPSLAQSNNPTHEATAVSKAKTAILRRLKDPESARFRDIHVRVEKAAAGNLVTVVCGQVNAKNSFGGYVGFRPFLYTLIPTAGMITIADDTASALDYEAVRRRCPQTM
jgi:hypothetical protein